MDDIAESDKAKELANGGFDVEAYRRKFEEDEKLLIQCLTERPGIEGCRYFESIRRKGVS